MRGCSTIVENPATFKSQETMSATRLKQPSSTETHKSVLETLERNRVIPLLTGSSSDLIFETAELVRGERDCLIGVDFSVPGIRDGLKALKRQGGNTYGVFSVSSGREARAAVNAGAVFLFSTHLDKGIVRKCKRERVFHAPGSLTPTEVHSSHEMRPDAVGIFPCSVMGGASWLMRLSEMFPGVKLIPTDRMTPDEAERYLRSGAYAVAPVIDTGSAENPGRLAYEFLDLDK